LPHSWNAIDGQVGGKEFFRGQCWYQRKLNVSDEDLNKFLFLEIGAASNLSEVYVNGQLAGASKCGYAMYRVPLNSLIKSGENLISIMVDNSEHNDVYPLMADFTFYGGLYREVKLIITESLHFDLLDNSRDGIYLTQNNINENTFELKINGRVINETPKVENALTKEHMDLDMSLIKEIGANSIRLAHYQHDDYFYSLCDRAGMLVWAEIPFISVPTTIDEKNQNAKDQLERLIKQAYNHSSIYCWGIQNEITIAIENENIYKKVKELEVIAKNLDSSRFINRHEALNDIEVLSNLDMVKLFIGEEFIGEINNNEAIKKFKEVKLSLGENLIKVEGYDKQGNIYKDEITLNHVGEIDKSYIHVKVEEKAHVTNWFEKFDLTNVQEVTLKDGYYSTFDTIQDLYENEETKTIFKRYFGEMAEHPRLKAMMGVTSIDRMSKITQLNIPKELLPVINKELNIIPKK